MLVQARPMERAAVPVAWARPPREGPVHVTAWTRDGVDRVALCAVPVPPVLSGAGRPPWPSDQVTDEHVLVRAGADPGGGPERWTPVADVIVRTGGPHAASTRPWGGALVTCVAEPERRRCAIAVRGEEGVSFTACDAPAGEAAVDLAAAFAWTASFVHGRLVWGRGLAGLGSALLTIREPGAGSGTVTLIPCGRPADRE